MVDVLSTFMCVIPAMEFTGRDYRITAGNMFGVMWTSGYVLFVLQAYFLRNWRHLQAAIAIPDLIYAAILFV